MEKLTNEEIKTLAEKAIAMRDMAYIPFSHFAVGAALLAKNGEVFTGCNIENSTFTPTICAERTAFFKAVSEGVKDFRAIVIAGGPEGAAPVDYCPPCGVCRQVMQEFCEPDFEIILAKTPDDFLRFTLPELLPHGFKL